MNKQNAYHKRFDLKIPRVIFGTSLIGNLFVSMDEENKFNLIKEWIGNSNRPMFDTAGKYGAGMALEILGRSLKKLKIKPENVLISNKLGWLRTELKTDEPTFESGVWKNLKYDAIQKISYDGIIECFEQGNQLLNGYVPQLVSVHDPDEYLARAINEKEDKDFYKDIMYAYEALYDLKKKKKVKGIGVGAKDWKVIQRIAKDVPLDWVMIANSLTIKNHPKELLDFIGELKEKETVIINAGIFHSGFLVGGDYYDYKIVTPGTEYNDALFNWRDEFRKVCGKFHIKPSEACFQFAINIPGVDGLAISASSTRELKDDIRMINSKIPKAFWKTLEEKGLISINLKNYFNSIG